MISVEASNLGVSSRGRAIISNLTLTASSGEVIAFMGRSGSGKTTILKALSVLGDLPVKGSVKWKVDGRNLGQYRPLGYLQQGTAIPDWFTARGFVRMCSSPRRSSSSEVDSLVDELLVSVGLDPTSDGRKAVSELSGGMATRVALAGAIATGSQVLVLDEPFAMVDDLRRYELLDLTKRILQDESKLGLVVTHSALEAAYLADRIIVLLDPANGEYRTCQGMREYSGSAADFDVERVSEVRRQINLMLMGTG